MRIYRTVEGFVPVSNCLTNFFESKFDFIDFIDITIPAPMTFPKGIKPYSAISKKDLLTFVNDNIKLFKVKTKQLEQLKQLLEVSD